MGRRAELLRREFEATLANPARIRKLTWQRIRNIWRNLTASVPSGGRWDEPVKNGLRHRRYGSYEEYVAHQSSKLSLMRDMDAYDLKLRIALSSRLRDVEMAGARVLCLAARRGGEVQAFIDQRCFAVGIDLNPGADNRYVLTGDFHDLQFADGTVDVVYTNSLDHALNLEKVTGEVIRVLRPGGVLLVDAMEAGFGHWEATSWESVSALAEAIESCGLSLINSFEIAEPWPGKHLRFQRY